MAMANELDQSAVAYRTSPDGSGKREGMPSGNKQFGKHKMPQDQKSAKDNAPASKGYMKRAMKEHVREMHSRQGRHKEHR